MSAIALRVEKLSKQYRIGQKVERYRTARETLARALTAPFGRRGASTDSRERRMIWALDKVSFVVPTGEVVGVIGRNGAGKSTLLKVLSRITEPTSGFADVMGKVGSLIEVGTGFHLELTGRENVFLNAAILGMSRSEVNRKFDEIVDFAEVEKFIDTPVKHYSTGMYLRLAFAVAAHLQPDILLVDEVLAVGDAAFQAKCLGKMGEVASQGRTVLFVSHNMSAITELCTRGLLLEAGRVAASGSVGECVTAYLHGLERASDPGEPEIGGCAIGTIRLNGGGSPAVLSGAPFTMTLSGHANQLRNPWLFFIIEDATGRSIVHSRVCAQEIGPQILDGPFEVRVDVPTLWLSAGVYSAYFKLLLSGGGPGGRTSSPRFALEVRGGTEHTGKALLHPAVSWTASMAGDALVPHGY